jgi:hypothetical protein
VVARNADRGAERPKLRAEAKHLNALFRVQSNLLDEVVHGNDGGSL